ncbi:MAG: DNA internalization-related competence protein ComEC/Rec2 [Elusimicrobiota bacterium]
MRRPLVAITVLYIIVIALLETLGVFDKIPKNDIARQATGETAKIIGRIISTPEKVNNKTSFILRTSQINNTPTKGRILVNCYDTETTVSYGDIIEISGNLARPRSPTVPGTFDYKKYLFRKKIYAILYITTAEDIKIISRKPSYIWQVSLNIRNQILACYNNNLAPKLAAVLSGITIGERMGLTPYIQQIFVDAGVMHVLVVSGSNVAFVAVIFFWLFRYVLRFKKKIAFAFLIPIILLYAMVTGANPPVVRATIMTLLVILALLFSRNADVYQGIFLAALIILIYNPLTLFEAGFQMSFSATLGIIYFFPKFQSALKTHMLPKFINWFLSVFLASLSAQIAIAPLMAYYFNKVSIIAIISNLIILPLIGVLLAAGFALYFTSLVGTMLLPVVAKITSGFVSLIVFLVDVFANVPYSTIRTSTPSVYFIILFYIIVAGIPKIKNYLWKRIIILASVILLFLPVMNHISKNRELLTITFIDVGLGDAVFCEFPDGTNMLVDGGGKWQTNYDIGERIISPFLWNKGITRINTVILTHPHLNHYQGLLAVCKNFSINQFITTLEVSDEAEYIDLMKILRAKKIPVKKITVNQKIKIGKDERTIIDILNPEKILQNTDDNSIVMHLSYNDFSILFCGDITKKIQNSLLEKNIAANFLFVPSHGKKLLSNDFLLKIAPEFAIISTDTPAQKVLEQLRWCRLFTTSGSGTIVIKTDGKSWEINETVKDIPMELIILDFE